MVIPTPSNVALKVFSQQPVILPEYYHYKLGLGVILSSLELSIKVVSYHNRVLPGFLHQSQYNLVEICINL